MNQPYLLDNVPVTAGELIEAASRIDPSFACEWFKRTSVAATILKSHNHSVEKNSISSDV